MANYIPPDAHHVNLNFKDIATGSADLNFGADEQNLASLEATINSSFFALFQALSFDFNALEAEIDVSFKNHNIYLNKMEGRELDNGIIFKATYIVCL